MRWEEDGKKTGGRRGEEKKGKLEGVSLWRVYLGSILYTSEDARTQLKELCPHQIFLRYLYYICT